MTYLPRFSPALLRPRYQLLWLGIGLLQLVVQLPYPSIYRLGNAIGRLAIRFMKRRTKIACRNLELCFPEKSEQEHHRIVVVNSESVGMGLMETGMAWFWPVRRIAHWTDTVGFEYIRDVQTQQRGVLLISIHLLTSEMDARMFDMNEPGIGVYRPNGNPVIGWLQIWGRLRSNKSMTSRKDLEGMTRALKKGEMAWHTPNHDHSPTASVSAPLFAVDQAAITSGTWMLTKISKAYVVPFVPRRRPDGKDYELIILPSECSPLLGNAETTATWMNKIVEQCIMMAPEQYM